MLASRADRVVSASCSGSCQCCLSKGVFENRGKPGASLLCNSVLHCMEDLWGVSHVSMLGKARVFFIVALFAEALAYQILNSSGSIYRRDTVNFFVNLKVGMVSQCKSPILY